MGRRSAADCARPRDPVELGDVSTASLSLIDRPRSATEFLFEAAAGHRSRPLLGRVQAVSCSPPPQPVPRHRPAARDHGGAAHARTGCPWDLEQNFATIAPTRSRRPTRSPMRSRAAISPTCAMSWAISCCRSSFTPAWRRSRRLRFRRRGRGHHRKADPPASACLRRGARRRRRGEGLWDQIKAEEKAAGRRSRAKPDGGRPGRRSGRPPALTRALKLQDKAGKVGFDWNDPRAVLAKIREETDEIEAELDGDRIGRIAARSATCCSPWSTSPATSTLIPRRPCGRPTRSSSAASPRSSGARRARQVVARGGHPGGNGRAVGRRQGGARGRRRVAVELYAAGPGPESVPR